MNYENLATHRRRAWRAPLSEPTKAPTVRSSGPGSPPRRTSAEPRAFFIYLLG